MIVITQMMICETLRVSVSSRDHLSETRLSIDNVNPSIHTEFVSDIISARGIREQPVAGGIRAPPLPGERR